MDENDLADALLQIQECLANGAEDSILALLTKEQILHLAEDYREGKPK